MVYGEHSRSPLFGPRGNRRHCGPKTSILTAWVDYDGRRGGRHGASSV